MDKFVKRLDKPAISHGDSSRKSSASGKRASKQARLTDLSGVVVGVKTSDHVRAGPSGQPYKRQSRLPTSSPVEQQTLPGSQFLA